MVPEGFMIPNMVVLILYKHCNRVYTGFKVMVYMYILCDMTVSGSGACSII